MDLPGVKVQADLIDGSRGKIFRQRFEGEQAICAFELSIYFS